MSGLLLVLTQDPDKVNIKRKLGMISNETTTNRKSNDKDLNPLKAQFDLPQFANTPYPLLFFHLNIQTVTKKKKLTKRLNTKYRAKSTY